MSTITLISGSTMGSSEYVAEHMAEILENHGFSTEVLHGPSLDDLRLGGLWLVVTSTHGAGDLPENLQPLADTIAQEQPDLSNVTFGSVGIGSSEYDIFCGAIKSFEHLLKDRGAKRIGDRLEIDIQKYEIPEDPAEDWVKEWAKLL
ncbi:MULTISPECIES: FMN-binding protein MioC [Xenorhabdus]|uniref:FMN-binding protein, required for biotin synthase activity n=3 Tax=Xenorhabdus TaxID=626 RepID=A0A077PHL2_XENBV|nr:MULTISPECIES: FMN-binding protein MioC [Xenorhabdus]MCG3463540.1 FMN-binding protein MioC [Xenorhabdus bovienii]MCP9267525.1 FMN-binding protein MioC [Xenorhabdus bovienii subsp. africana]MDC9620460.1 FMN-binding protein MioC [Xenorhabdus aichiensis]MDE1474486.1 FMN-binding protein MioC [Xenorhabdus bovienii]MDE1479876.1 FMN-binding protein MioC [Xenorhabdus bovienii]